MAIAMLVCLSALTSTVHRLRTLTISEESFEVLDLDDDELVTRDEFVSTLTKLNHRNVTRNNPSNVLVELQKTDLESKSQIEQRFWSMDSDGDGLLSHGEFVEASSAEDVSNNSHQEKVFTKLDRNTDEAVSYEEFESGMENRYVSRSDETLKEKADSLEEKVTVSNIYQPWRLTPAKRKAVIEQRFDWFDQNRDSLLTLNEYLHPKKMYEIHLEFVKTTFTAMDENDDETISQDEFVSGMLQQLHDDVPEQESRELENEPREFSSDMRERIIEKYNRIDSNGDGRVTPTEMEAEQHIVFVTS
ncbi:MAG: EF-hand domain-containing protein [Gammaproteobacteria bacterium]|nr:EF-hand domain-containing protein [Gammaproteobacteria bacterium]